MTDTNPSSYTCGQGSAFLIIEEKSFENTVAADISPMVGVASILSTNFLVQISVFLRQINVLKKVRVPDCRCIQKSL